MHTVFDLIFNLVRKLSFYHLNTNKETHCSFLQLVDVKARILTSFLTTKFGSLSDCLTLTHEVSPTPPTDQTDLSL